MKNEINSEDLHTQLQEQIKVIYDCEKKLETDRNNCNCDLVRKNRILTEEELASHDRSELK
ncbi:hypothetical protein ACSVC9_12035 [Clostridium sp. LBM24168]